MLHIFWAEQYGEPLSEQRQSEVQLRAVTDKLARVVELDQRPLTEIRPPEKRFGRQLSRLLSDANGDAPPSGCAGPGALWVWPVLHPGSLRGSLGLRVLGSPAKALGPGRCGSWTSCNVGN